jgi:hypothetical protein
MERGLEPAQWRGWVLSEYRILNAGGYVMIEIKFQEKIIQYEDAFLYYLEQPATAENVQKLATYCVLHSEALMDEQQASYIDLKDRIAQLEKNAKVLAECRVRLRFDYRLGGAIIETIDATKVAIKRFVQLHSSSL